MLMCNVAVMCQALKLMTRDEREREEMERENEIHITRTLANFNIHSLSKVELVNHCTTQ